MNERDYIVIATVLTFLLTWLCFNRIRIYIYTRKSKKLELVCNRLATLTIVVSLIMSIYMYSLESGIYLILRGYILGVSIGLWGLKITKEKSENKE